MGTTRIDGNLHVAGTITCEDANMPAGCIENAAIAAGAGLAASKLEHQFALTFAQANTTAADETKVVHCAYGATGDIISFEAGSIVACIGDSTVTVDLKKNGATVLDAVITLDSANSARVAEAGTISTATFVDGDVLEVVVDATVGTGTLATGLFATVILREDAS